MSAELLASPAWLHAHLGDPAVKVVDASWYLPAQNRDAKAEYRSGHIPGAVFFDIEAVADRSTSLPHMLPSAEAFAAAAGTLGLSERDTLIIYDGIGLFSAPRVWWTFRVFGARDVRVLDGGLPAWKAAGLPLEAGEASPSPAHFRAARNEDMIRDIRAVAEALENGSAQVVDARSAARFRGEAPEPRPGLPSGHMPGSHNLPFDRLAEGGKLLPPERIRALFEAAGVDLARPVVTSCGSGVTAAVLALGLARIGKRDVALYDGSWAEWASKPEARIATGDA
jgi:thiosulfate/3-mercaptopyruvate sulfurtransferase